MLLDLRRSLCFGDLICGLSPNAPNERCVFPGHIVRPGYGKTVIACIHNRQCVIAYAIHDNGASFRKRQSGLENQDGIGTYSRARDDFHRLASSAPCASLALSSLGSLSLVVSLLNAAGRGAAFSRLRPRQRP